MTETIPDTVLSVQSFGFGLEKATLETCLYPFQLLFRDFYYKNMNWSRMFEFNYRVAIKEKAHTSHMLQQLLHPFSLS